jgi:DNA-binding CsgD family transcriptional regulator
MSGGPRPTEELIAALVDRTDLRSRLTQAQHLVNMISMRPSEVVRLWPLLIDALDAAPAVKQGTMSPPQAAAIKDPRVLALDPRTRRPLPPGQTTPARATPREPYPVEGYVLGSQLTEKQLATVQAIADGDSLAVISAREHVSTETLKSRMAAIQRRLGTDSYAHLAIVVECFRRGLIT